MENDLDKQTNTLVAIIIFAVSVIVLLLIIFIIFNSVKNSNIYTITGSISEIGWLNSSGYTLSKSGTNIIEVKDLSGDILSPGNYTFIGNKLYNNTPIC